MGDRLDLIPHDLLLLQAQEAELDVEAAILLVRRRRRKRQRRPKALWVRPWLQAERRLLYGHHDRLMTELRRGYQQSFFNFLRMPAEMFDELINRVGPRIQRMDTHSRKALQLGLKLAVTLRHFKHLAAGDKYPTLQYDFRVARNTICNFIPVVCQAIVDALKDEVISCPTTPDEWRAIADEFLRRWNVPHACGALDGKHVAIRCPGNSGS